MLRSVPLAQPWAWYDLPAAFASRKVVVVGDIVADEYLYGQTDRISREAPVLIVRYESSEVKLGGAGNAAANLRALGARVSAVGTVGDDAMGVAVQRSCRSQGIRLSTPSAKGLVTETKTRIMAGGVNTTRQQMLRVDRGSPGQLPPKVRKQLASLVREAAADADALLVSDYGGGVLSPETVEAVLRLAKEGLSVCVDSRYNLGVFKGVSVAKPNEPELEALTGLRISSEASLLQAGKRALRQLQCRALLVTRGRNGMALFTAGRGPELIPVHGPDEAVDVTGAGDTVASTLALALAAGGDFSDAARLANVAGGLVVQKPGTATVTREELAAELRSVLGARGR